MHHATGGRPWFWADGADVVIGGVCSAAATAVLVRALTNPYPGSDFTDQLEVIAIGLIV